MLLIDMTEQLLFGQLKSKGGTFTHETSIDVDVALPQAPCNVAGQYLQTASL